MRPLRWAAATAADASRAAKAFSAARSSSSSPSSTAPRSIHPRVIVDSRGSSGYVPPTSEWTPANRTSSSVSGRSVSTRYSTNGRRVSSIDTAWRMRCALGTERVYGHFGARRARPIALTVSHRPR